MTHKSLGILTDTLREKLASMDVLRDAIWNLEYKDFEDMKWAIKEYDSYLEMVEDIIDDIKSLFTDEERYETYIRQYTDRYNYHLREHKYFSEI